MEAIEWLVSEARKRLPAPVVSSAQTREVVAPHLSKT